MSSFRSPSDSVSRQQWVAVFLRRGWKFASSISLVCSNHLMCTDFLEDGKVRRLKKAAVPSLFEEQDPLSVQSLPVQCTEARARARGRCMKKGQKRSTLRLIQNLSILKCSNSRAALLRLFACCRCCCHLLVQLTLRMRQSHIDDV